MSELQTTPARRFVWPADYYSGPSPAAVLPRGVTFGCGAASIAVLLLIFAGGAFLGSGGLVQFMDFALGMSMGDVRGMYTAEVTAAQKQELETAIEQLRAGLRGGKVSVQQLQPVLDTMRRGISDKKLQPAEVQALTAAARKATAAKLPPRP
jgi:ABC-type sugar transport system substrate-binding protein